ncbi:MAG: phosphomannomutase/phosphoglucomutase [Betaproteobacteria bacterium]|nr:phosphomannomutase/phosphoglucomutase [Betaproteobacteria bacterium]MDH5211741.1 phosphomannomutase/phosphoglucomutase [Betaproteobacteria bacterium]MDH5579432.1 phosphomannomutase/phosphoglucomutase [Betaproteobacteria bacterium]
MRIPAEIFRAYDIRGIAGKTLTADAVRAVGRALGSMAADFAVGRDGRDSGPALVNALAEGLQQSGANVIDVGMVPTPATYFAAHHLGCGSCVSVTGSHNPPEYNGLKMVVDGHTLSGDEIQGLRRRIERGEFRAGAGRRREADVLDAYVARITGDVRLARRMRIAIDCGNGVAGVVAPRLYRALDCEVQDLYSEVDATFPNHHPDPSHIENLADLIAAVKQGQAELGLAFDGDGDRLGVVTKDGAIIYPDRQLMLFAADVLSRNPGAEIIYDVKSTRLLAPWIERHGGKPLLWKTGHSLIKAKLAETGAPLAGEMSGHTFFKERWYGFDDALYAGARLLEILSRSRDASGVLAALPDAPSTPELQWKLAEGEPHALIEKLQAAKPFPRAARTITIDGVRAEYADGFGLARASNTTPVIVLRFEADTKAALARIQEEFRAALEPLKPGAPLPF